MVTSIHEASHRIFQERPDLLIPAFRILGVGLPSRASVDVLSADVTEIRPLERRVDSVLRVESPDGSAFLLAIEAQGRRDADKASSWAYYLAYLRAKYDVPVLLLVICQDKATATWAAGPFHTGLADWTALTLYPLVLGPDNVPRITDPEEAARDLALATFSAMTHGREQDPTAILEALATALGSADDTSRDYYFELLEIGLGDSPAKAVWKDMMHMATYFPGRGTAIEESYLEGEAKGKAEGKAEERVHLILRILEQRGLTIPADIRERVTDCSDLDMLGRWLDQSFTVTDVHELFADADGLVTEAEEVTRQAAKAAGTGDAADGADESASS